MVRQGKKMIDLNLNLSYLLNTFEISTRRINEYSSKSLTEIMEIEASEGNKKATGFSSVLADPAKVAKIFQLSDAQNRYLIIRNLSPSDLQELMKYLSNEDLVRGLQFLTMNKLMELMSQVPQEELLKLVFEKFGLDEIISLMPKEELDGFLENTKVERKAIMNIFEKMREDELQKLMMQVMGTEIQGMKKEQIITTVSEMENSEFNNMVSSFNENSKRFLVANLIVNDNKLVKELSPESLIRPFALDGKEEILKSVEKLDPKFILPMMKELPDNLLQVVATQIEPDVFAEVLVDNFSDILKEIGF